MAIATTALTRNLSRLELALAVLVVTLLVVAFLRRMATVEVAAEEALVRAQVQDMQARLMTLRTEIISGTGRGRVLTRAAIVRHLGRGDLHQAPVAAAFAWDTLAPGSWVYFQDTGELVYRVRRMAGTAYRPGAPPVLRFQLTTVPAAIADGGERVVGATLQAVAMPP